MWVLLNKFPPFLIQPIARLGVGDDGGGLSLFLNISLAGVEPLCKFGLMHHLEVLADILHYPEVVADALCHCVAWADILHYPDALNDILIDLGALTDILHYPKVLTDASSEYRLIISATQRS